jgi:endonuclease-3
VGRKTANVVASVVFKKPVMAVDTHVFRVSNRIGLVKNAKTPLIVEIQLSNHIPPELIHLAHHWLILHGRYVCKARNPLCSKCGLTDFCKYYNEKVKKNKT